MVLSENENISPEIIEKWIFTEIRKDFYIVARFTDSNQPNRIEIHDFSKRNFKLFELNSLTFNNVLDRFVEIEITLGAMVDSIRSYLREEGAYNHKTIEAVLNFMRNVETYIPDIEFFERKELVEYQFYLSGNQIPELY